MTLLDRYFLTRLLTIGMFAVLLFTIAWLAPEILFKAIQGIGQGQLTLTQGLLYLFYQIPQVLVYCIPISTLIASVFFFRQLSLDAELTVLLSSGIAFRRLLVPVAVFGLVMGAFFLTTQEAFVPWSSAQLKALNRLVHLDSRWDSRQQVTFVEKSNTGAMQKFLVLTPEAPQDQNRFIFLFYDQNRGIRRIITATHGQWHNTQWQLQDGVDYTIDTEGIYKNVIPFNTRWITTSPVAHALLAFPTGNPAAFNMGQLRQYVHLLQLGQQTEDAQFYEVRLYQRYFLPWVPVLFAVFGAAIGIERSRARRNLGLTYAAVLLLLYNVMVPVFTTLGSINLLPSLLAAALPLGLVAVGGWGILTLRQSEG